MILGVYLLVLLVVFLAFPFWGFGVALLAGVMLGIVSWRAPLLGGMLIMVEGLVVGSLLGLFGAAFSDGITTRQAVHFGLVYCSWPAFVPGTLFIVAGLRRRSRAWN